MNFAVSLDFRGRHIENGHLYRTGVFGKSWWRRRSAVRENGGVCSKAMKTAERYNVLEYLVPVPMCSILTWYREHRDQDGGFPRKRLFHCTSVGLAPAITPNVGNSGTQFICVGDCVRANP